MSEHSQSGTESSVMNETNGCGQRLREAREAAGLTMEQIGKQLHTPTQVVQALEGEHWDRLGAPVFVRGQLRSYAKLLGVNIEQFLEQQKLAAIEPAQLVSHTSYTPPLRKKFEGVARSAIFVLVAGGIITWIWWVARPHFDSTIPNTASLDVIPVPVIPIVERFDTANEWAEVTENDALVGGAVADVETANVLPAIEAGVAVVERPGPTLVAGAIDVLPVEVDAVEVEVADEVVPVDAVVEPVVFTTSAVATTTASVSVSAKMLSLRFIGDCWTQVYGLDGKNIEQALFKAGDVREYQPGEVGRIILGAGSHVEVLQGGNAVDLAPYLRASVVRLAVSAEGELSPSN